MGLETLDVSVIIPTRNRVKDLRRCLRSLKQQTLETDRFEVIAVNDGSVHESHVHYTGLANDDVGLRILHQRHAGPAAARNLGASASHGRVLAFTDDDAIPDPEWLERALHWLAQNEGWLGLEGAIEAVLLDDSHPFLGRRVEQLNGGAYASANMFYRRDIFFAVGGFDPAFRYPFREDTELASRVRRRGEIGFRRDVVVRHPVSPYRPWDRALRARYLANEVHMLKVSPSFFARQGIARERDIFLGALVVVFRNERERNAIRAHPSLLPLFLISVGLEKVAIVGVFAASAMSRHRRRGAAHPGGISDDA